MINENKGEAFSYTYSTKQQEKILNIRKKYMPKEEDKMAQLLRLDKSVTQKGTMISLIVGIIGALILGIGMCCTMVWKGALFVPGVVIGIMGIIIVSLAYPVNNHIVKNEREKVAPEIMRLTDELMK